MAVGASLTTLASILKEFYVPPVVETLNNKVLLLSRLDTATDSLWGKYAVVPIHTQRSGGVGARPEYGTLPDPGSQGYLQAQIDFKQLFGVVKVSGISIAKTDNEAGSFLKALKAELDYMKNDLTKDLSRQFYGDGTGTIATATATSATTTTFTLSSSEAIDKGQIYIGMYVDVFDSTGATRRTSTTAGAYTTVTAINTSNNLVTVAPAMGTSAANGDLITRQGAVVPTNTSYELTGLRKIVTTSTGTTLFTVSASTAPTWDNSRDTTAGAITIDRMVQMQNRVLRNSGDMPTLIVTTYGGQRAYFNLLQSQVRYTSDPQSLKGGFKALDFQGNPVVADLDAPYGQMFFLTEPHLKVFAKSDWGLLETDGTPIKWVPNQDAWQAIFGRYMELGCDKRNCHGVISGFTDTGF